MTTVLNNRTVKEMENFLSSHGTQSKFFHANLEATDIWIETLKTGSDTDEDIEPLVELVPWMLQRLAKDRPTSHQVVNNILHFESRHAFFGICCGNEDVTLQSAYDEHPPPYTEYSVDA